MKVVCQAINISSWLRSISTESVPLGARILMVLIAVSSNLLLGYSARRGIMLLVLPLIVSTPLYLIADMDSPRGGIVRVVPQNLMSPQQAFDPR